MLNLDRCKLLLLRLVLGLFGAEELMRIFELLFSSHQLLLILLKLFLECLDLHHETSFAYFFSPQLLLDTIYVLL